MATDTDVDERREDLLQSIEQDEEELREAVHELAEVTERKLDFSQHIRSSPVAWVVGAFCVGLWMGMARDSEHSSPIILNDRRIR